MDAAEWLARLSGISPVNTSLKGAPCKAAKRQQLLSIRPVPGALQSTPGASLRSQLGTLEGLRAAQHSTAHRPKSDATDDVVAVIAAATFPM